VTGKEHQDTSIQIGGKQAQSSLGHDAINPGRQVSAAGADGMGEADAEQSQSAGHFLHGAAGGADNAYGPAWHTIGKAEANAGYDRGATIGPHDEKAQLERPLLEIDLVLALDVAREQEDVPTSVERALGHEGGMKPRNGDGDDGSLGVRGGGL
jgi:hypothetical protein